MQMVDEMEWNLTKFYKLINKMKEKKWCSYLNETEQKKMVQFYALKTKG